MEQGQDIAAQERERLFEDRWSAYGANTGILRISERLSPDALRRYEIFQTYDDAFLETLTPDITIATWKADAILFEEGSYLDLAFYIIDGEVNVYLTQLQDTGAIPIFDASRVSMPYDEAAPEEADDPYTKTVFFGQVERQKDVREHSITYLSTMDFDLPQGRTVTLGPGAFFGEIGTLNGWPQSVTARTASEVTLAQIRVPALRQMKKKSSAFSDRIDTIYRERTLFTQLKSTPLFRGASDSFIDALAQKVALVSCAPGDVVAREGEAVDALYLVRSGFLKLSQRMGSDEMALTYLSKGMTFGEVELLIEHLDGWQFTTTSVGFTELVKIERDDFLAITQRFPTITRRLWESAVATIKETGRTRGSLDKSELIEFSLAKGLVQGNSILVIDLDVCTRCDDCVRGCEHTHGGRPRFVREGEKYHNFLVARSCYHCEDPVCLIGCPTGAIRRANVGEVVEIDDGLCIGCSNCATKCPYDAIIMHDTKTTWPDTTLPEWLRGRERKVASKCDLCYTAEAGPACVNNCPHACAFRVSSLEEFQDLLAVDQERP
ncbi:MAG: cyclic nucleotide-binding domain-containing protein [Rhodothermales bacterium]